MTNKFELTPEEQAECSADAPIVTESSSFKAAFKHVDALAMTDEEFANATLAANEAAITRTRDEKAARIAARKPTKDALEMTDAEFRAAELKMRRSSY